MNPEDVPASVHRATEQINSMLMGNRPFEPNHARSVLSAALRDEEIARVLAKHSTYVFPECTGCGAMISMLPDEDPVPVHQADMLLVALLDGEPDA